MYCILMHLAERFCTHAPTAAVGACIHTSCSGACFQDNQLMYCTIKFKLYDTCLVRRRDGRWQEVAR